MVLLDTDILIDYLRLYSPALRLLDSFTKGDRFVSILSQMELLKGCKTKQHEQRILRFIKNFKVFYIDVEISQNAFKIFRDKRWQGNMDIPDSFIAATAKLHDLTLLSRNLKHYRNIPSLKVEKPY